MSILESWVDESSQNKKELNQQSLIVDVAENIMSLLDEEGLNQAFLAKELGKTPSYVSQLLNGSRNMTLKTLADIGTALNKNINVNFFIENKGINECADELAELKEYVSRLELEIQTLNTRHSLLKIENRSLNAKAKKIINENDFNWSVKITELKVLEPSRTVCNFSRYIVNVPNYRAEDDDNAELYYSKHSINIDDNMAQMLWTRAK